MAIRFVDQLPVEGKRVFVRVDFNVPLDSEGNVTDDTRIVETLPTIQHLLDRGAKLILASHLGRPKGKPEARYSLEPAGARLAEKLGREVFFAHDCVGDGPKKITAEMRPGQIVLLENTRFHKGEEANDEEFSRALA